VVGLLILTCLFFIVIPNPFRQRIMNLRSDIYAFERTRIWKSGLMMIKNHPLGIGLGMFKYYSYRYNFPVDKAMAGRYERHAKTAHNEYIHLAAEMSPLAPLLLAVPAAMLLLASFRASRRARFKSEIIGPGAGLLTVVLHCLFDSNLHNTSIAVLAVIMAGVLVTELSREGGNWVVSLYPGTKAKRTLQVILIAVTAAGVPGYLFLGFGFGLTLKGMEEKSPARAMIRLGEATQYDFGNATTYKLLANSLYLEHLNSSNQEYLSEAIKAVEWAIELNPEDPQALRQRAQYLLDLYRITGESPVLDWSEAAFKEALLKNPFDVDACQGLALVKRYQGNKECEVYWWKRAVELEPYDLGARLRLSRSLLGANRIDEAEANWKEFLRRREEVRSKEKSYPWVFSSSYKAKRVRVDEVEIMNVKLLLQKALTAPQGESHPR